MNPQATGQGLFLKEADEAERGIVKVCGGCVGGDSLRLLLSTVVTVDPMKVVSSIRTAENLRSGASVLLCVVRLPDEQVGRLGGLAAAASSCSSLIISRRSGSEMVCAMKVAACDGAVRLGADVAPDIICTLV